MIDTIKKSIHYNRFWLIREIKKRVKPFLHASGFDVQLAVFKQQHHLRISGDVLGFTYDGIMSDEHAGGMCTTFYNQIPIEDLVTMYQWNISEKTFK